MSEYFDPRYGTRWPNWKVYGDDARNARLWFEGYCKLAEAGIALLEERDKLRAKADRLRQSLRKAAP